MRAIKHYRVTLDETSEPKGFASAAVRGCMCCGSVLSGMGGGGLYLCQDCLDKMHNGEIYDALAYKARDERLLAEARAKLVSWPDLFDESMRLATPNDVLRAEVAELKATIQPGCCGIATCPGVAEARQEAAREIVDMLFDTEFEGPNKAKFEKVVAAFISHIKSKFKLEG